MPEGLILRLVYYRYEWYNNLNPKGEIVSMSTVSTGLSLTLEAAYQDDVGVKSFFAPDSALRVSKSQIAMPACHL